MPRSVSGAPHPQVHYFSERLRARLDQIPEFRTTFVEAQSGAGKTTAVQDFFGAPERTGASVRWFVAGEEPHSSGWARLCRVLNDIDPEAGAHLLRLGFPVEENQGEIAQALMELRCDAETYLVCDNFQFVQKNLPASVWKALIEHGGDGLRLVILTRQLSSRGLTVLGNADVLRIDNDDFCLTAGEIGAYYRMAGVELDEDEMRSLHRYSEGWIVALYLQLMSFFRTGSLERKASVYELMNELLWKGLSRRRPAPPTIFPRTAPPAANASRPHPAPARAERRVPPFQGPPRVRQPGRPPGQTSRPAVQARGRRSRTAAGRSRRFPHREYRAAGAVPARRPRSARRECHSARSPPTHQARRGRTLPLCRSRRPAAPDFPCPYRPRDGTRCTGPRARQQAYDAPRPGGSR